MGVGTRDDFKIYPEYVHMGMVEEVSENLDLFNGSVGNTLQINVDGIMGDTKTESFFLDDFSYDDRRVENDTGNYSFKKITMGEQNIVDMARVSGYGQQMNAWYKVAKTPEAMSSIAGRFLMRSKIRTFIRDSFAGINAGMESIGTGVIYDGTGDTTTTLDIEKLNKGFRKYGDLSGKITTVFMHSKVYGDMLGSFINNGITPIFNITDLAMRSEYIPALGRQVVINDNPAFYEAIDEWKSDTDGGTYTAGDKVYYLSEDAVYVNKTGTNTDTAPSLDATNWEVGYREYYTYALTQGAGVMSQGIMDNIYSYTDVLATNTTGYIKSEYNCNLKVKGMSWKTTAGTNPTLASLSTKTNWEMAVSSLKNTAGVKIVTY